MLLFFFFNEPATTGIYTDGHTLSPHHPLPIYPDPGPVQPWQALLDSGAVQRLRLSVADVNQAFAQAGRADAAARPETGNPADTFIDLYAALVSVPAIGRSLLGDATWQHLASRLQPGQQALLVAGNGAYSFKGSGYVRGGIFDRIEIIQQDSSFRFRDRNHQRLADVAATGAPSFAEVALFVVPDDRSEEHTSELQSLMRISYAV